MTLKPGLGSLKVIGTDTDRSAAYDFLLTFHSNHGLSRTVSEIDDDFSQKSQNFPTPVYYASPLIGFPLELGIALGVKYWNDGGLPGQQRSLTISSAVWIQCDRRTDRHRATAKTALTNTTSRGNKSISDDTLAAITLFLFHFPFTHCKNLLSTGIVSGDWTSTRIPANCCPRLY